jgi:hypothetical protein
VVDLSLGEEDDFPDTSRGEEITRKLFGDLNCGLLGPPNDGTPKGRLQDWAQKSLRVNMTFALLHHIFFCKSEWGWWCRVIATFMPFMPPTVFVSIYVLVLSYVLKVVLL